MKRLHKFQYYCAIPLLIMSLAGCVTMEAEKEVSLKRSKKAPLPRGIYHKVKRGETLWRISKAYNVSIGEITRVNKIPKEAKIEKGQLLFIPNASKALDITLDTEQTKNDFIWPIEGEVIKFFHQRYSNRLHKGIDIKARVGDEVKASRTGRVVFADYLSGYGYTIILDHSDGYHSVYSNNSKLLVGLGDTALKGGVLARVGHNRNLASMHFQIRKKAMEDNPLHYLP